MAHPEGPREEPKKNKGSLTRRAFLGAAVVAGLTSLLIKQSNTPAPEKANQPPAPEPPKKPEQIPVGKEADARSILFEQIMRGEEPRFGMAEAMRVDVYWKKRYAGIHRGSVDVANKQLDMLMDQKNANSKTYRMAIAEQFRSAGVPEPLMQIGFVETGFRFTDAKGKRLKQISKAGAVGPFQFKDATAIEYGLNVKRDQKGNLLDDDDRLDAEKAAGACARYLKNFATAYLRKGATSDEAWYLAAYAYNGGFAQKYLAENASVHLPGFYAHLEKGMRAMLKRADTQQTKTARAGDTVLKIARRYQVDPRALRKVNPKLNWSRLKAADRITIPALSDAGPTYEMKANDTLASLAKRWGIPESDVVAANPHVKDWAKLPKGLEVSAPKTSAAYQEDLRRRKIGLLGGYIENIDYVGKLAGAMQSNKR